VPDHLRVDWWNSKRKAEVMSAWILRFSDNKITVGVRRPITVFSVTGDGDETKLEVLEAGGEEHPGLRDLVRDQIKKGRRRLILDLGSVHRIDSDGVGEIVVVWQHAKNRGGELVLANPQPRVHDLFEILYLDKVIPIFDSISEAVEYLNEDG